MCINDTYDASNWHTCVCVYMCACVHVYGMHMWTNIYARSAWLPVRIVVDVVGCVPCSRLHGHRCVPEGEPDYNDYMMSHFIKPLDIPDLVEIPLDTHD